MTVQTTEIFMKQTQHRLSIKAKVQGLHEITEDIASWVATQPVREGMLTIYIRHTSASILIQENFDTDVERDIETFFHKLVPEELDLYTHIAEGEDDMPAHIKGALTQTHLNIPLSEGKMTLGQYQGIYLFEHRRIPRDREMVLHAIGQ
jgi:secondary thiamine-phosphate synthase enzyme